LARLFVHTDRRQRYAGYIQGEGAMNKVLVLGEDSSVYRTAVTQASNVSLIIVEPIIGNYVVELNKPPNECFELPQKKERKWYDFKKGAKRK
jgi:hypothetical protein